MLWHFLLFFFVYTLYIFQAFCMIVHLIVIIIASL